MSAVVLWQAWVFGKTFWQDVLARHRSRTQPLQQVACALFRAIQGRRIPRGRRQLHHIPSPRSLFASPASQVLLLSLLCPCPRGAKGWRWEGPWVMIERECFARSMPASKKASAGPIMRQKAVARMIHVVSPVLRLHSGSAIVNLRAKAAREDDTGGQIVGQRRPAGEQDPRHRSASLNLTESLVGTCKSRRNSMSCHRAWGF